MKYFTAFAILLIATFALCMPLAAQNSNFNNLIYNAKNGSADAQFKVGEALANGIDIPKDAAESVKWYIKSAEQGHAEAQFHLGEAYLRGEGIEKDAIDAYAYLNLAGITLEKARASRNGLELEMTKEQIAAGQRKSKELKERIRQLADEARLRKAAEEQERRRKAAEEQERLRKAAEEQERLRKAAEEQERLRKAAEEQERLRKAAEEQERLREAAEEQERLRKAAEEQERLAEEQKRLVEEVRRRNIIKMGSVSGRILAVNKAWNFFVLNVGEKNGVLPYGELLVKRGATLIGRVSITSVEQFSSIAEIIPGSLVDGLSIQPGDYVVSGRFEK